MNSTHSENPTALTPRRRIIWMAVFLLTLLAVGVFYVATIRAGQDWSDDFAMYIHHAKNIATGVDYQATGYIYDPINAVLGPRYYPPVYPLLLAPVYSFFGLDLYPMKVETVVLFVLFLWVFILSFRSQLSKPYLLAAVLTIGFNPRIWEFKDGVTSDIPFLLFTYLALYAIEWSGRQNWTEKPVNRQAPSAALLGMLIYLSFGVRSVGVILIPCLFAVHFLRSRKLTLYPWLVSLVFAMFWAVQSLLIPGKTGYFDQLRYSLSAIRYNITGYGAAFLSFWANGYISILTAVLALILLLVAGWGFWRRIKTRLTVYEFFLVMYTGVIVLWISHQGERFLIPLIPIFCVYLYQGLADLLSRPAGKVLALAVPVLIAAAYVGAYTRIDFGPFTTGVENPQSVALFEYIRENTQADDVLLFARPRALSLYTDRSASGYSSMEPESYILNWINKIGMDYVIVGHGDDYLRLLVKRYPERFTQVYVNADYKMYRYEVPTGN